MPIKYKPTEKILNRVTKKITVQNHYMHTVPTSQLVSDVEEARLAPKRIAKIRKELVRRERIAERARQGARNDKRSLFLVSRKLGHFLCPPSERRCPLSLVEVIAWANIEYLNTLTETA